MGAVKSMQNHPESLPTSQPSDAEESEGQPDEEEEENSIDHVADAGVAQTLSSSMVSSLDKQGYFSQPYGNGTYSVKGGAALPAPPKSVLSGSFEKDRVAPPVTASGLRKAAKAKKKAEPDT